MKPYGSDHEPKNVRNSYPDQADVKHLGLSSKHGKQRSKGKRSVRRYWKKIARKFWKKCLSENVNN